MKKRTIIMTLLILIMLLIPIDSNAASFTCGGSGTLSVSCGYNCKNGLLGIFHAMTEYGREWMFTTPIRVGEFWGSETAYNLADYYDAPFVKGCTTIPVTSGNAGGICYGHWYVGNSGKQKLASVVDIEADEVTLYTKNGVEKKNANDAKWHYLAYFLENITRNKRITTYDWYDGKSVIAVNSDSIRSKLIGWIWTYYDEVGLSGIQSHQKAKGVYGSIVDTNWAQHEGAKEYAEKAANKTKTFYTTSTKEDKITVDTGYMYTFIGPFNLTYGGDAYYTNSGTNTVGKATIFLKNGTQVETNLFSTDNDHVQNLKTDLRDGYSGNGFYVVCKKEQLSGISANDIKYIELEKTWGVRARMVFGETYSQQDIGVYFGNAIDSTLSVTLMGSGDEDEDEDTPEPPPNEETPGEATGNANKIDKEMGQSKPLEGVEFKAEAKMSWDYHYSTREYDYTRYDPIYDSNGVQVGTRAVDVYKWVCHDGTKSVTGWLDADPVARTLKGSKAEATPYYSDENGQVAFSAPPPELDDGTCSHCGARLESNGKTEIKQVHEINNPVYGYYTENKVVSYNDGKWVMENLEHTGNLQIRKRDTDSGTALAGVSFKIKRKNGQYIIVKEKVGNSFVVRKQVTGETLIGELEYTSNPDEATTFITNSEGNIDIYHLLEGTYEIYETSVGNNIYHEVNDDFISWQTSSGSGTGHIATVTISKQNANDTNTKSKKFANIANIYNRQRFIDLSGYAWEEMIAGKGSEKNGVYGGEDKKLANIPVKIVEKNGGALAFTEFVELGSPVTDKKREQPAREAVTDENGEYKFELLEIDKLKDYTIVFEYNGISYESIIPNIAQSNGSKAAEGEERPKFNAKFETITNNLATGTDGSGTGLEYNGPDNGEYRNRSELIITGDYGYSGQKFPIANTQDKFKITADTWSAFGHGLVKESSDDGTILKTADEIRKEDIFEIEDLNLGVYEREQVDLFITKDLKNVRTEINGDVHVYEYGERFKHLDEEKEFYDIGVKFGQKYGAIYTQPIYRADYSTNNRTDLSDDNKLHVYLTYEIALINQASEITTTVNSVRDYMDMKYNVIGTGTDENKGVVSKDLNIEGSGEEGGYKFIDIDVNETLEPQQKKIIYVEIELPNEKIHEILDDVEEGKEAPEERDLINIVEISSYSSSRTRGGNDPIYAGIDKNSNPGDVVPGDETTYENDTDKAPGVRLAVAYERKVEGTVFLDDVISQGGYDTKDLMTGYERKGNGQYDSGETPIKGITVRLVEKTDSNELKHTEIFREDEKNWRDATEVTDASGYYELSGYTPGKYVIEYEWGEIKVSEEITINAYDYKGTNYQQSRVSNDSVVCTQNGKTVKIVDNTTQFWYRDDALNPRYTDALDDYDIRVDIDGEHSIIQDDGYDYEGVVNHNTKKDLSRTMIARTPIMNIRTEDKNGDTTTKEETAREVIVGESGKLIKPKYYTKNIDYGIIERARQQLQQNKRIERIQIWLQNGTLLMDTERDVVTGKLKADHLIHQPASNNEPKHGIASIQIDKELIQGSTLDIYYAFTMTNNSELDYAGKNYYYYGNSDKAEKIKLAPSKVIDYSSDIVGFTDGVKKIRKEQWEYLTQAKINELNANEWKQLTKEEFINADLVEPEVYGEKSTIEDKKIFITEDLEDLKLEPGQKDIYGAFLYVSRQLVVGKEDQNFICGNESEIVEISKNGGRLPIKMDTELNRLVANDTKPGNYVPGYTVETLEFKEPDDSMSEEITVTPPTGEKKNYVPQIVIGITSIAVLGVGIVLIKKMVIGSGNN